MLFFPSPLAAPHEGDHRPAGEAIKWRSKATTSGADTAKPSAAAYPEPVADRLQAIKESPARTRRPPTASRRAIKGEWTGVSHFSPPCLPQGRTHVKAIFPPCLPRGGGGPALAGPERGLPHALPQIPLSVSLRLPAPPQGEPRRDKRYRSTPLIGGPGKNGTIKRG